MAITTLLDSSKLIETLEIIITEWLTGAISDDNIKIYPFIVQDVDDKTMDNPWCEFAVAISRNTSTGAGALRTEGRFKFANVEIGYRVKKDGDELDLVQLGDKVDNFFRNATEGFSALGTAGLRKASLDGPFPDNNEKYYLRRWFLNFRVLATNA